MVPFSSPVAFVGMTGNLQDRTCFSQVQSSQRQVRRAMMGPVRRYEHYCPVAHALDMVGDRWELLIVRELLLGPKRYTDLADGLPGIGTNILAARLRDLEACGVIAKKTLPPPAASRVYDLTDYGRELRPVMRELALWGARSLGPPTPEAEFFPGWL